MNKLSAKHFILFILGVTIISFKTYTSLFIAEGGRDTWIYTIVAFLILALYAMFLVYVATSKNLYSLGDIFTTALSKSIGNIFILLFSIGLLLASLEAVSVEANVVKTCFFPETPVWYIIIFFLFPSFFIIGKRIRTLLIFIIITVSALIVNSIILALLSEKYRYIKYITPVLSEGIGMPLITTTLLILGSLSSFAIALPYLKYITTESKLKKHSLIALSILGLFTVYTIIGIIATFGPLRAANIFYPEFIVGQRIQLGGFIEFGEFFFLYQTIIGLSIKYILCVYGITILYEKTIKNTKLFMTIYSIAIFIAASFISRNNYILFDILKYYQIVNIILFILVPIIPFTILKLKKTINLS